MEKLSFLQKATLSTLCHCSCQKTQAVYLQSYLQSSLVHIQTQRGLLKEPQAFRCSDRVQGAHAPCPTSQGGVGASAWAEKQPVLSKSAGGEDGGQQIPCVCKGERCTWFSITGLCCSPLGMHVKESPIRDKSFESPHRNYYCFKNRPAIFWLCQICIFLEYKGISAEI